MSNDATDPLSSSEMLEGLNLKALLASGLSAGDSSQPIPKLPGYEVIERIGRGGMGSVYLARQLSLDRLVAVKVISVDRSVIEGQREILLNRLESEARVMAKLNHPNLVSVYDFVKREDGGAAIVMELVSNGNIREQYFSQNSIPVSAEKVATLGEQVASCLQAAHSVGVIHRDIKPENLLVDEKGEVKVSDFGLALDSESIRLTASGMSVGTLGYSSPEQLEGLETDERADLYSLGVVMYELLTGRKPMGDAKRPSSLRSDVPRWLEQVIIDALQPERNQRIKSAAEFKVRLEKGRTGGSKQKAPRSPSRKWPLLAWGIATACVLLFGGWMISKNVPATQSKSVLEHSTVIQGNYEKVAEGLRTYSGTPCFFGVSETPSVIGKTIRVEFTRISGATPIAIFFKHPQGFGSVLLDAWRQGDSGVEAINDETLRTFTNKFTFFIENGRSYVFEARFEKDRIITSVDGNVMQDLVISNERLSIAKDWNWPTSKIGDYTFVVGTFKNEAIIHSVTIDGLPL